MVETQIFRLKDVLQQYRNTTLVNDKEDYGQITISKKTGVQFRETRRGKIIGRKRQFRIDLKTNPNTLIFTRQGVADGSVGIAPREVDQCIATENMPMFRIDAEKVDPELLANWLKSKAFKDQVGTLVPTGSAQKAIHERDLLEIKLCIPKHKEDQIKLKENLFRYSESAGKLDDEHLAQSTYLTQLRQAILQEAIEGKLTADWREKNLPSSPKASEGKNPSGLPQASHLPLAGEENDGSESSPPAKGVVTQAVSQTSPPAKGEYGEAGRGFLTPQDEKELPAEYYDAAVLLAKIKAEKAALVAAGKLKKEKPLPPIEPGEVPFALPEGWVWTRLGACALSMTNGLYKPSKFYKDDGIISLRMYNIDNGLINFKNTKRLRATKSDIETYGLKENDLLVNRVNSLELVGKAAVVPRFNEPLVYESMNVRVRFLDTDVHFINILFQSDHVRSYFLRTAKKAIGQASINQTQIGNIVLGLPPLAEQHAIVERVDKLLGMVDQLEQQVAERKVQAEELMQAVLREAFG